MSETARKSQKSDTPDEKVSEIIGKAEESGIKMSEIVQKSQKSDIADERIPCIIDILKKDLPNM